MDSLLEFLPMLLVGIGIWTSVSSKKDKEQNGTPQAEKPRRSPFGEVFPELETPDELQGRPAPVQDVSVESPNSNIDPMPSFEPQTVSVAAMESAPVRREDNAATQPVARHSRLSLRTKSEVKRAFIYSEVLNRKY